MTKKHILRTQTHTNTHVHCAPYSLPHRAFPFQYMLLLTLKKIRKMYTHSHLMPKSVNPPHLITPVLQDSDTSALSLFPQKQLLFPTTTKGAVQHAPFPDHPK